MKSRRRQFTSSYKCPLKRIKQFNGSLQPRPKFVSSFGADFPLEGRDEHSKYYLMVIKLIFEMESVKDLDLSKTTNMAETSYSILANGPGTGKSRFLQDLPTLIKNKAQNYIDDDELLEMLNNKMLSINITFNTNTGASEDDVSAGPASVALRILYEHFISSWTIL
ncbi:unnamed protein product [Rhizophagus irregularis]|nr:unnamed protein product [Rhizophagus irregularis]